MAAGALIQGSSRGIGLQFCRLLLARSPSVKVIATCRCPDTANDLQHLSNTMQDRLHILQLDVTNESQIQVFIIISLAGAQHVLQDRMCTERKLRAARASAQA